MKWFWICLFGFLALLVAAFGVTQPTRMEVATDSLGLYFDTVGAITIFAFKVVAYVTVGGLALAVGLGAAFVGVKTWNAYQNSKDRRLRMVDGAFPLIEYRLPNGGKGFWNPNASMDEFAVMSKQGFMAFNNPEFGPDRRLTAKLAHEDVNKARAVFPGDHARTDVYGSQSQMPRSLGSALRPGGGKKKERKLIAETPTGPIYEGEMNPKLTTGLAALKASRPDRWIVGQAPENNGYAVFRPMTDVHAAIVGATGSGKTVSLGYLMAMHAVNNGRCVILDGDEGIDWRRFAGKAEWMEADRSTIEDQIAAILAEKMRRDEVVSRYNLSYIGDDPAVARDFPPTFIVVEEFGSIMDGLRAVSSARAANVDRMLDAMMRRGRKAGIHFILVDQYPDKWTDQTLVNAKTKYVFRLDGGKQNKVSEPKADTLDVGQFMLRRDMYHSFDMKAEIDGILANARPARYPQMIDGSCTVGDVLNRMDGTGEQESAPEWGVGYMADGSDDIPSPRDAPKREVVYAWRDHHPEGTQAEFRQWLDEKHGVEFGRGYISDCFAEWERMHELPV